MYLADRYEIVGKVGAGGMSDVYKAKDHILGRFVAIKVLKPEFSEDMNFVTKFRTEAQSAAGLEHPNIVNIYDVGSENGMHYIVMEYVEGITLKTYIEKKGQLSFKESVSIAIQVARGIEAAHNKEIIHRDIKPQNIIISTEGKVKVTDFGIARAASSNTISSDVMGSVHYASPEQARNGFVDGRSDIYSLGIVMYEMVTGRVPFDGDTTVAVAIQHLQEEMVSPSAYASDLPISMEKIIIKCTQKNPDRRYQTIAELLADLRKSLISPNEDFVVMVPLVDNAKTKVISEEDLQKINEGAEDSDYDMDEDAEEFDEDDDLDEDDEEDEEEGTLNPKMDKAVTIMGIVAAVVIVLVIIYLIGSVFGLFKFGSHKKNTESQVQTESQEPTESETTKEKVKMIDITGKTAEEAEEALEKIGLKLFIASYEESDKYEKDQIIEQDVAKGKEVNKGSTISVIVCGTSKDESKVKVPGVVGQAEDAATSTLSGSNLKYQKQYEYNDSVPAGQVISQSPVEGSSVDKNSSVTIVISQGAQLISVQNVISANYDSAKAALEAQGLVVARVDKENDAAAGTVIDQDVAAGKSVSKGTTVTLTVSSGPKKVTLYKYSGEFTVPEGALTADFVLNVGGKEVASSTGQDVSGKTTQTFSASNLTESSGQISITWHKADGTSTENQPVTFEQQ